MDFENNESFDNIEESIDQLIESISDSGHELYTKEQLLEEMKTFLSQISILNKLKDGIIVMPFDHKLSIRPNECHKYVLLLSIDKILIDINIRPDLWRFNLEIRSSQSDDNQTYCLTQCESIELNRFLTSETVPIILELSQLQYSCLPLLINVSLVLEIPQNLIKYVYDSSDLSKIETLFDIQLTQWSLNEFHFLSFVGFIDECFDYKEIMNKDLKSMNRLEDNQSDNESEAKLYTNSIFLMIETLKESINNEPNDNICSQLIKYLIPKQIPVDCIVFNTDKSSASLEAFYFGHKLKLIASIIEMEPKFLNMTIEAQNPSVMTTIRKALIESLNNLNPISIIDENKISLSSEHRSQVNDLIDRLKCVNNNKDVIDIYMDVRHKVSQKLAFI